jgi:putative SOS response-associated peptidase YedK
MEAEKFHNLRVAWHPAMATIERKDLFELRVVHGTKCIVNVRSPQTHPLWTVGLLRYNKPMCGRFTLIAKQEVLEHRFHATFDEPIVPRYNAAPDQRLPVVLNTDPKAIKLLQWGIQPVWLAKLGGRKELINVKAETLKEKKTFSGDLKNRRCLVLADSFYEWQVVSGAKRKTPYRILLKSGEPFSFAGIWEEAKEGEQPRFAIITTTPNDVVKEIHHRMPVILTRQTEKVWLDADSPVELAVDALQQYPARDMRSYAISTLVNRATVDVPAIIMPVESSKA